MLSSLSLSHFLCISTICCKVHVCVLSVHADACFSVSDVCLMFILINLSAIKLSMQSELTDADEDGLKSIAVSMISLVGGEGKASTYTALISFCALWSNAAFVVISICSVPISVPLRGTSRMSKHTVPLFDPNMNNPLSNIYQLI